MKNAVDEHVEYYNTIYLGKYEGKIKVTARPNPSKLGVEVIFSAGGVFEREEKPLGDSYEMAFLVQKEWLEKGNNGEIAYAFKKADESLRDWILLGALGIKK